MVQRTRLSRDMVKAVSAVTVTGPTQVGIGLSAFVAAGSCLSKSLIKQAVGAGAAT